MEEWLIDEAEIKQKLKKIVESEGPLIVNQILNVLRELDHRQIASLNEFDDAVLRKRIRHLLAALYMAPVKLDNNRLGYKKPSDCKICIARRLKPLLEASVREHIISVLKREAENSSFAPATSEPSSPTESQMDKNNIEDYEDEQDEPSMLERAQRGEYGDVSEILERQNKARRLEAARWGRGVAAGVDDTEDFREKIFRRPEATMSVDKVMEALEEHGPSFHVGAEGKYL